MNKIFLATKSEVAKMLESHLANREISSNERIVCEHQIREGITDHFLDKINAGLIARAEVTDSNGEKVEPFTLEGLTTLLEREVAEKKWKSEYTEQLRVLLSSGVTQANLNRFNNAYLLSILYDDRSELALNHAVSSLFQF